MQKEKTYALWSKIEWPLIGEMCQMHLKWQFWTKVLNDSGIFVLATTRIRKKIKCVYFSRQAARPEIVIKTWHHLIWTLESQTLGPAVHSPSIISTVMDSKYIQPNLTQVFHQLECEAKCLVRLLDTFSENDAIFLTSALWRVPCYLNGGHRASGSREDIDL